LADDNDYTVVIIVEIFIIHPKMIIILHVGVLNLDIFVGFGVVVAWSSSSTYVENAVG
jgi:hypothetical protein